PARRRQCDLPQLPIRRLQRGYRLHDPRRPAGRARQSPPRVVERLQPGRDHAHHPRRGGPVAARRQHGLGDRSAGRMRAPPALLAAVLLAAPAVAQDKPEWVGVWEGRIASYPVRACFDTWSEDGPGRGSYYYRSRREPLSLVEEDGGRWTEHAQGSDTGATWQFTERSADRLRGTWRQGGRSLAFELNPVAWTEGEWGGPCGSEAYFTPRLLGPFEVRQRPGQLGDFAYEYHTLVPPEHFREDVTIETFQFTPEQPGDPEILAALRGRLPAGTMADPFADCLAGAISVHGTDGSYFEFLEPIMAAPAFLGVRESSETYCGGAHPNAYYTFLTFDRQSGAAVELFDWLSDEAREH